MNETERKVVNDVTSASSKNENQYEKFIGWMILYFLDYHLPVS